MLNVRGCREPVLDLVSIVCFLPINMHPKTKKMGNVHEICKRKANWIGHILCRNWLLQWVTEGKIQGGIEVTGRQGRRRRKLLDNLKERRGYSHLKEETLDRTMWRAGFGRGFGPVVRQAAKWNEMKNGRCVGLQPYHLHMPIVLKPGSLDLLEPSGPVQACNGIALPLCKVTKT
jgi:hypothetical protein